MTHSPDSPTPDPDRESALSDQQAAHIQQELRRERSFSIADAIAQEGASFMKGACPIPPLHQAIAALKVFIGNQLDDDEGALEPVLIQWITADEALVCAHLDQPLDALRLGVDRILATPGILYEIARQANMKWGEIYGEQPRFQRPQQPAPRGIAYSHDDVRSLLMNLNAEAETAIAIAHQAAIATDE